MRLDREKVDRDPSEPRRLPGLLEAATRAGDEGQFVGRGRCWRGGRAACSSFCDGGADDASRGIAFHNLRTSAIHFSHDESLCSEEFLQGLMVSRHNLTLHNSR